MVQVAMQIGRPASIVERRFRAAWGIQALRSARVAQATILAGAGAPTRRWSAAPLCTAGLLTPYDSSSSRRITMLSRRDALAVLLPIPIAAFADPTLPVLRDAGDQRAFCAWFTWLAEAMFFAPGSQMPDEVRDCSSLVRFAYRNALMPHTAAWARSLGLAFPLPPLPESSGRGVTLLLHTSRDESAHFADAAHLMRYNFRRIAGEWRAAQPGDTLFWNQKPGMGADHCMVWLGPSRFETTPESYVVYHTGPEGKWAGEVRRPSIRELLNHPEPRWRPVRGNPRFLGVFRWNLLLGGD